MHQRALQTLPVNHDPVNLELYGNADNLIYSGKVKRKAPVGALWRSVNRAGFEPATSALSRQRSKPAELTVPML